MKKPEFRVMFINASDGDLYEIGLQYIYWNSPTFSIEVSQEYLEHNKISVGGIVKGDFRKDTRNPPTPGFTGS